MTGNYPRAYWHVHIGNDAIYVSWGPKCLGLAGDECDGLRALAEESLKAAYGEMLKHDQAAFLELLRGDE